MDKKAKLAKEIRESLHEHCFQKWMKTKWWRIMNDAATELESADGALCRCYARCQADCACGADWTPKEVLVLRKKLHEAREWVHICNDLPEENEHVLWCHCPVSEPPYVMSMCDDDFEAVGGLRFFTHWIRLPEPPTTEHG
jgi:hypothetical protein